MARPLRIEFSNAIYHVMARGNGRQAIFHIDDDYQRMTDGLAKTVSRTDWQVLAYVWMPNHIHLLVRTPKPNLSRGMQYLLSGYANWYAKRHQRTGHLFQGRFKAELVEDDSYFWTLSRYLYLNPVRGKRPLVDHPNAWAWSSYPGFGKKSARVDWIDYDSVLAAWQGEMGGKDAGLAYRRFVESGLETPPPNPLANALEGWLLGSENFLKKVKKMLNNPKNIDQTPKVRRLTSLDRNQVIAAVAGYFKTTPASYQTKRSTAPGRDLAAYLPHRRTTSTLRELATVFGLSHPDSVSNLIRRAEKAISKSKSQKQDLDRIDELLQKQ
jgi:REP element-mobilizing transposase RayT